MHLKRLREYSPGGIYLDEMGIKFVGCNGKDIPEQKISWSSVKNSHLHVFSFKYHSVKTLLVEYELENGSFKKASVILSEINGDPNHIDKAIKYHLNKYSSHQSSLP